MTRTPTRVQFWRVCYDLSDKYEGRSCLRHTRKFLAENERRQIMRDRHLLLPKGGKAWLQKVVIER